MTETPPCAWPPPCRATSAGSNLPEQHPIIYWRLKDAQERRGFPLIVVDPRVTMLAQNASLHLPINPGTDVALMNAMMHVIFKEGLEDREYIEKNCVGLEELKAEVEKWTPDRASQITGIHPDNIVTVARAFAKAPAAMQIWTMGINQSSITGQCNAMGTREWSSCSGLPNFRYLENEEHRKEIAEFWGVDP